MKLFKLSALAVAALGTSLSYATVITDSAEVNVKSRTP